MVFSVSDVVDSRQLDPIIPTSTALQIPGPPRSRRNIANGATPWMMVSTEEKAAPNHLPSVTVSPLPASQDLTLWVNH